MGIYLNPGNAGFQRMLRSGYIDKTDMLSIVNDQIDTVRGLICISRPRRFGKSYAAQMTCAYYDCTCDSHKLFDGLKISECSSYEENEEIKQEFENLLKNRKPSKLTELISRSEKLLSDTLAGNGDAVAEAIKNVRATNYAPTFYNNEQSLRYAIKFAYIVCIDRYMKVKELPSGKGYADVVYIPKSDTALPALVVELKWEKNADAAIEQIKNKHYHSVLEDYFSEIILVGINYDSETDKHTCVIEKIVK